MPEGVWEVLRPDGILATERSAKGWRRVDDDA
jgi:hypothetical protein